MQGVKGHINDRGRDRIVDHYISHTGDDVATLMARQRVVGDAAIRRLVWDAFRASTDVAKAQGLYGAGQDLLKDVFSGNVKGMGPAVAEMQFDERPNENLCSLDARFSVRAESGRA